MTRLAASCRFGVHEQGGRYRVRVHSRDRAVRIVVDGHLADASPAGSVFADVNAASRFFRCAPVGYAATPAAGVFDGVELDTVGWALRPLQLDEVVSSYFDDPSRFPRGTAVVDSAFLMSGISTTWRPQPRLRAAAAA